MTEERQDGMTEMTEDKQDSLFADLQTLTATQVLEAFINWHGTQLLTDGFADFVYEEYFS